MAWDTVTSTVDYARSVEKEHGKNFRFTITTNGMLLDDEKIEYINREMYNCVLSLDGRKEVNDNIRRWIEWFIVYPPDNKIQGRQGFMPPSEILF